MNGVLWLPMITKTKSHPYIPKHIVYYPFLGSFTPTNNVLDDDDDAIECVCVCV